MDNYRRRYGYQEPPQINPNLVDFGQLPMYNPQDTERLAQIGQQAQQRYDTSQATIAKYLEDVSAADFSGLDQGIRDRLMLELDANAARIQDRVSKDYQGDYGRALPEILKGLSRDRGLMHQGVQESAKAKQAFAEYQDLAKRGMAPRKYFPGQGFITMDFEDYHKQHSGRLPGFNEEGKFVGGQYATLRGAGQHEDFIMKNFSKELQDRVISMNPKLANIEGVGQMLQTGTLKGVSDDAVERIFFDKNGNLTSSGKAYVETFKNNSQFAPEEFGEMMKDDKAMGRFVADIVKAQTVQSVVNDYKQYEQKNKGEGGDDGNNLGVLASSGLASGTTFTSKDFREALPNSRQFFSAQAGLPLNTKTFTMKDYSEGKATINQVRASKLEQDLRRMVPELETLYTTGIKTNDEIAKEVGFDSYKDYYKYVNSVDRGDNAAVQERDRKTTAYQEKRNARDTAVKEYSGLIEDYADQYIKNNKFDTGLEFNYYQPDYSQEGVSTQVNAFNTAFKTKANSPDQFTFLNGNLKGKTPEEISKAFENKEFATPSVGGNEAIGLLWEVVNPDGTKSDAKWNTGYQKQANALKNVYNRPDLIRALNADVIQISENGALELNKKLSDIPNEVKIAQEKYRFKTTPSTTDLDSQYLNFSDGEFIRIQKNPDGTEVVTKVKSIEEATPVNKAKIFDILQALGKNL